MNNDNTTHMSAETYDRGIINTIPYYSEFFEQTFDVIEQCGFDKIRWLDLGCGTGTLTMAAIKRFDNPQFVMVDPSEKMLETAKEKLADYNARYILSDSMSIDFSKCFDVVTAIQSHHYMHEEERKTATANVYRALRDGGIYISFENVVPEDNYVKNMELLRWARYQMGHGKTWEEAKAHISRCGVNYYPITVPEHIELLKNTGFKHVHVFWYSCMQMGIYGIK